MSSGNVCSCDPRSVYWVGPSLVTCLDTPEHFSFLLQLLLSSRPWRPWVLCITLPSVSPLCCLCLSFLTLHWSWSRCSWSDITHHSLTPPDTWYTPHPKSAFSTHTAHHGSWQHEDVSESIHKALKWIQFKERITISLQKQCLVIKQTQSPWTLFRADTMQRPGLGSFRFYRLWPVLWFILD